MATLRQGLFVGGMLVAAGFVGCARQEAGWRDEMTVRFAPCTEAKCGPGGSCRDTTFGALCTCGAGYGRTQQSECVPLVEDRSAGCTVPEHCDGEQLCERLTGKCRARAPGDCGVPAASERVGIQSTGDFCHAKGSASVRGCGELDAKSFCSQGLACVPTGPEGASGAICGAPERVSGVCRTACDPCAPACPKGEGCFVVSGVNGGVCLPRGVPAPPEMQCGDAVCAPGQTCALHGRVGGAAHGHCTTK